jgi:hypothetical protein
MISSVFIMLSIRFVIAVIVQYTIHYTQQNMTTPPLGNPVYLGVDYRDSPIRCPHSPHKQYRAHHAPKQECEDISLDARGRCRAGQRHSLTCYGTGNTIALPHINHARPVHAWHGYGTATRE